MTQEALRMALEFIENSECGTADLEARIKEALAQTQEPVAYLTRRKIGGTEGLLRADMVDKSAKNQETHDFIPLYKEPKPCPTCEALARTVMLDQTSHDTPPQRKPLTDEEIYMNCPNWLSQEQCKTWVRQIEAAHGIKE